MKRGDTATQARETLRAVRWKDRRDVYILTNIYAPPVEGNFTDESGQAIKPRAVEDYNKTEWSTAMELPPGHGSGPRNCLFT
jgi:hypothetical protein